MRKNQPANWPVLFAQFSAWAYPGKGDSENDWAATLPEKLSTVGWELVQTVDASDAEAFVAKKGEHFAVSVRGTQPTSWPDLLADLRAMKNDGEGAYGFRHRAAIIETRIGHEVRAMKEKGFAIHFMGHSLGYGTAAALALDLRPTSLVGFGGPRTWTPCNAARLEERVERIARFCNLRDPVPLVPPIFKVPGRPYGGFRHAGKTQFFNGNGDFKGDYDNWSYMLARIQQAFSEKFSVAAALACHNMDAPGKRGGYLQLVEDNLDRIRSHFNWPED